MKRNFLDRDFPLESAIRITNPLQLCGELESDKVYIIDGTIDMGDKQITVPQGGLVIYGLDLAVSGLTTSENNHTLFIDDGVFSGDLFLRDMFVTVSGTSSQVFDLDNAENGSAVECTMFNFVGCTSLGTLSNYRQGLWDDFALVACADGLTMDGTWSGGFAILTTIVVEAGTPFTGTILKAGGSLVVNGSIRSDMNALQIDDSGAISDLAPANVANDNEFRMNGVRCNPNATPFPNMPASNVKAKFSNCVGFRNTYVGGQYEITTEAATNINTISVPEKVAGTTTYTDMNHFSNTTDNAFVSDGSNQIGTQMQLHLSFTGPNNDEILIIARHWVDSMSAYVDLSTTGPVTMGIASRPVPVSLQAFCDFDQNDRFEVWVQNNTSTGNITAKEGGIASITERPS